ncbi:MAG: polyphosphate kinase 2 [Magnetococcales bacterium]|nr:polyphosphate kinase 2 [Magnetococcales bacterium]
MGKRSRKEREERKARKAAKRGGKRGNKQPKAPKTIEGGIPVPGRKARDPFYTTIMPIQNELLKLHTKLKDDNERVMVIVEGRATAGKAALIKRFTEFMLPKGVGTFRKDPPTETEAQEWYFQRFMREIPAAGQVMFYNRSYYTRAWVDAVTGACSETEVDQAMAFIPALEKTLMDAGVKIIKLWLSVSAGEQKSRVEALKGTVNAWQVEENMNYDTLDNREAFTAARDKMFAATSQEGAPWVVIDANDEKQMQINALQYFTSLFDYDEKRTDLLSYDEQIIKVV